MAEHDHAPWADGHVADCPACKATISSDHVVQLLMRIEEILTICRLDDHQVLLVNVPGYVANETHWFEPACEVYSRYSGDRAQKDSWKEWGTVNREQAELILKEGAWHATRRPSDDDE